MDDERKKHSRYFFWKDSPQMQRAEQVESFVGHLLIELIKAALNDPLSYGKNTHFDVKKNKFQLLNIRSLGAHGVLVFPQKDKEVKEVNINFLTCI